MTCSKPIEAGALADYWIGALANPQEQEDLEEHLFACDECGARLREVIALAEGIRKLAREGSLRMIVSDEFLKRLESEGLRLREYAPTAGGSVQCTVTADDDLLVGRLAADLRGAVSVDLVSYNERGVEQGRMPDIPVHSGTSTVIYQESITFAKSAPAFKLVLRLVAIDEAGGEKTLGEYTFNHTRSLPGPGSF